MPKLSRLANGGSPNSEKVSLQDLPSTGRPQIEYWCCQRTIINTFKTSERCASAGGWFLSNWPKNTRSREWSPVSQCSPWPRKRKELSHAVRLVRNLVRIRKEPCITQYWKVVRQLIATFTISWLRIASIRQKLDFSMITFDPISRSWRWIVLPHAPYSLDLAPSDYYLFRSMEQSLRNMQFMNI